jgi:hypothetical protein
MSFPLGIGYENAARVMRDGRAVGVTSRPEVAFVIVVLGKSCGGGQ